MMIVWLGVIFRLDLHINFGLTRLCFAASSGHNFTKLAHQKRLSRYCNGFLTPHLLQLAALSVLRKKVL